MREKKDLILDVLTGIDEVLLQKNLEKRYALWQKPKRRRNPLIISLISAAACILLLVTGLFAFMRTPDDVPVYHGMTISKEDEIKPSDTAQTAGISGTAALRSPFLYAPKKAVFPARMIYGGPEDKKPDKDLPVFGQNYYAMPGEDIYINIHLSNPGGYEILSFTLNGVKYSSYMFEPGSDLETLILKTNVGETGGLKEYTIDAIKYVDGEKIKDVKMKGDRTVKVFVNDDSGFLQLETEIDGLTLNVRTLWADTFTGEKKLLSLALYEDDVLYKELAPDASFVNGLPLGKRFVLRAEYLDQGMPQTVNHVFTMPKESEGLVISNGLITGIGTCSDTVLYLDHPIAEKFLYEQPHLRIQEVYMTDNVTSIGESAFRGCKYLTKVRLSRSLTAIPDNAFKACILLKEIIIPNSITSIGECAFSNCGITSIHIPISVVEMKRSVFALNNFETPSKEHLTIYCAAKSKPAGWDENWGSPHTNPSEFENGAKYPVIWNTKYTEDTETCKHKIVIDNAIPAT
ncbi:MAG: leucine-rich repeat domain-containing protein, partial [Clostridia bacterium]|nr:leucine-rich repeat domain-containing protein [Clostridia bacterium]